MTIEPVGSSPGVPPLQLTLFVALNSATCATAIENMHRAFRRLDEDAFELEVVDVFKEPERTLRERVFVTPTLLAGALGRRVVGNLSDPGLLDFFLRSLSRQP